MSDWGAPRGKGSDPRDESLIQRYLLDELAARRRMRRWRWVRGSLWLLLLAAVVFHFGGQSAVETASFGPHTAVVSIHGEIAHDQPANADSLVEALQTAFDSQEVVGVLLNINSPGGSPVQADQVYREIRRLRSEHPDIPLHAVIGDMGASGAYYIAAAADRIFVNPSSLVGSIGVIMPGFGVPALLQKLGVEDRTLTAGAHKNVLSPARAVNPDERAHVQSVLDSVHRQFIQAVKTGRGKRLGNDPDLFSGYFWSGEQAIGLGLADAVGSLQSVSRDLFKQDNLVDYTLMPSPIDSIFRRLGMEFGSSLRQGVLGASLPSPSLR